MGGRSAARSGCSLPPRLSSAHSQHVLTAPQQRLGHITVRNPRVRQRGAAASAHPQRSTATAQQAAACSSRHIAHRHRTVAQIQYKINRVPQRRVRTSPGAVHARDASTAGQGGGSERARHANPGPGNTGGVGCGALSARHLIPAPALNREGTVQRGRRECADAAAAAGRLVLEAAVRAGDATAKLRRS